MNSGLEIKSKILEYYSQIDRIVEEMGGTFPLNNEIKILQDKIAEIVAICDHKYDDHDYCIYCYSKKNNSAEEN